MLALDRKSQIVRLVETRGSVRVAELASLFGVTEETIRRDLDQLAREGLLRRTHGGAVSLRGTGYEAPVLERSIKNVEAKTRIGARAVQLLEDGDTCILDASTTALQMARQFPNLRVTVLTNSIPVAQELVTRDRLTVIGLGGMVRERSLSFVGPLAERALRNYHVDKVFLSCKGIDLEHGLTDSNELEVELKKLMVEAGREVIVLADASKIDYVGFSLICSLDSVHKVVTEEQAPAEFVAGLRERGIEVLLV